MSDMEIIEATAKAWLENGGDSDGFAYCMNSIVSKIIELEKHKTS